LNLLNKIRPQIIDNCIRVINPALLLEPFDKKISFIASKWNDDKYSKQILEWAGLPADYKKEKKVILSSSIQMNIPERPYKMLKDYQMSVFQGAEEKLQYPVSHFVIQMPTGSGKTRTAMEIVTNFINEYKDDIIVVWLAHSGDLCDQASECFEDVWSHVARKELTIYQVWGERGVPRDISGNAFLIGGFPKLYKAISNNAHIFDNCKNKVRLLIIDEAHKAIAPTYKQVIDKIININTKVIGLTATPGRNTNDVIGNEELSAFFHNAHITIQAHGNSDISVIEFLRKKRVLANLYVEPISYAGVTYELTPQQLKNLETEFEFPQGFLDKLSNDNVRNIEILKRLEKKCRDKHKIIFFGCNIKHSKFICSMLIYLGYNAVHVDGSTDRATRNKILKDFRDGNIQVICNFGVLATGFDAPKIDVVCIARPTASIVLYSQMIGRGLRGPAIGGTADCTLINVKDNIKNLPSDLQNIFDFFDGYWQN
jgi:superfamily II DNA or RNA helicase